MESVERRKMSDLVERIKPSGFGDMFYVRRAETHGKCPKQ